MRAFHTNCTAPFFANGGKDYCVADFDLLCSVLSALFWRRENGSISMITDKEGLKFYKENGLEDIWDGGVHALLPDLKNIDNIAFWAAGKLYALKTQKAPCVMIDTDFIVWDKLNLQEGVTVAHREELGEAVYPEASAFRMKEDYRFNESWDWSELACNTAFAAFDSEDFKNYYTDCAIDFISNAKECDSVLTYMVFAEQRLLAMCAKEKGVKISALMDYRELFGKVKYTHLWGYKQVLRENGAERTAFCRKAADRIAREFPEYAELLKKVRYLSGYFGG